MLDWSLSEYESRHSNITASEVKEPSTKLLMVMMSSSPTPIMISNMISETEELLGIIQAIAKYEVKYNFTTAANVRRCWLPEFELLKFDLDLNKSTGLLTVRVALKIYGHPALPRSKDSFR